MSLIIAITAGQGGRTSPGSPTPTNVFTSINFRSLEDDQGQQTISAPMTFTLNATGAIPGYRALRAVEADGVNVPDIDAFSLSTDTDSYVNIVGTVNYFDFLYDGSLFWVTIHQ